MKERHFAHEVQQSIPWLCSVLERQVHYAKIPDAPKFAGSKFNPQKIYDAFFVDLGRHHVLEYKMSKGMSIGFDALNEAQEQQLMSAELAGGRAFVVVNFRVTFSALERKRRNGAAQLIAAFAVPIVTWLSWRSEDCRASIPLSKMETDAIVLPRLRLPGVGIGWDLRPLLGQPS